MGSSNGKILLQNRSKTSPGQERKLKFGSFFDRIDSGIETVTKVDKVKKKHKKNCWNKTKNGMDFRDSLADSAVQSAASSNNNNCESVNIKCRDIARQRRAMRNIRGHFDSRLLDKYIVVAMIGKGSFSRVVQVEGRQSGRSYAVKIVPAKNGTGPFENEMSILNKVYHPFVIRLAEVFRSSERVYMIMEMATGGELYDRIVAKGRYTEPEAISTIRMLLSGVQYLHQLGITHRDLKPENLLYSNPGADARLLITDFGLAHFCVNPQIDNTMTETCGTPEYISPEVLLRMPYSNKVDVWFWSSISDSAREFVDSLLVIDPLLRVSADRARTHPWLSSNLLLDMNISTRNPINPYTTSTLVVKPPERSRSSRSLQSITRSDHGHRVRPKEMAKLALDPEIKKIAFNQMIGRSRQKNCTNRHAETLCRNYYGIV